ncbi:MAG: phage antirepressor KilAC domain-containing protein [Bacteroidales bacterium]|nr:phage antirepressor KilAC domain-containing protein [Bacteroidales bacterium]
MRHLNENQIFQYNGSPITFQKGDSVMINANQMSAPFGKAPKDWLRTQQSNDYLNELSKVKKCPLADLVSVTKGGNNPGTWMHEDVALEFARWLSPSFAIWCNDRIKELLKTGVTTVSNDDEAIAYAMSVLQKRLEQTKTENQMLQQQNQLQTEQLREAAPKVEYVDNVLQSANTYTANQIAKELGFSAETLNKKLKDLGVQYKQSGQWLLSYKYQNRGYTKTRTYTYTRADGSTGTAIQTVWTESGRMFIHNLLKEPKTA